MSCDERLVNIESGLTHLEKLVDSLNETIVEQGEVIQQLLTQMQRITSTLESEELNSIKSNVTKPPHYQ